MTIRYETQLWQRLAEHSLVAGEEPALAQDSAPWYVRTMLGIAGWVGALFLLGAVFTGFALFVFDSLMLSAILGSIACIVAIVIYRAVKNNDFMAQFGFAISLAGQGLLIYSMLQGLRMLESDEGLSDRLQLLALLMVVLQAVLFLLIPNFLHRLWSGVLGISALMYLLILNGVHPFTSPILLAVTAWVWLQEFNWAKAGSKIQPLGYSLIFVCFAHLILESRLLGLSHFWQANFSEKPLGGGFGELLALALSGAVLIAVVCVLLKRSTLSIGSVKGLAAILLAVLVAIVGVKTPGITIALVFVLIGYAHGNRVLLGIGLVTLLVFLSQFYYQLELSLLYKSLVLFFSGLALLLVRQLMNVFWPRVQSLEASDA